MSDTNHDGTKDYRFMAMVYDPAFERFMRPIREKALQISDVRPGDRVLDLCCGTGRQSKLFADAGADVCGVDLSDFMIVKAKKKETGSLVFTQGDAANTGYGDSTFDLAFTGLSLHEVDEEIKTGFLCEMQRVVKPGGGLIITDFSVQTQNGFRNGMVKRAAHTIEWLAGGDHYRNYLNWMSGGGLAGFVSRIGLHVEKTIPVNGGHFLIVKAINMK